MRKYILFSVVILLYSLLLSSCDSSADSKTETAVPSNSSPLQGTDSTQPSAPISTQSGQETNESLSPADSPISLSIVPQWEIGEKRIIEIVKSKIRTIQDVEEPPISSSTGVEITVLDTTDDGYIIQWEYGETTFSDEAIYDDPYIATILGITKGMKLEYEIDHNGVVKELRNWEEVQRKLQMTAEIMIEMLRDSGLTDDLLSELLEMVTSMFSSEESIAQYLEDVNLFHLPLGLTFDHGNPITYSDLFSNPFGGDPIHSEAEFSLISYDLDSQVAVVRWEQVIEVFNIKDSSEFILEGTTGWTMSVDYQRETSVGSASQVERTQILDLTEDSGSE